MEIDAVVNARAAAVIQRELTGGSSDKVFKAAAVLLTESLF